MSQVIPISGTARTGLQWDSIHRFTGTRGSVNNGLKMDICAFDKTEPVRRIRKDV
jgi:hypothetical protein